MDLDATRLELSRTNLVLGGLSVGWIVVGLAALAVGERLPAVVGLFLGAVFGYRLYTRR